MTAFDPRSKGYFMSISTVVFLLKVGKYLPRYFKFPPLQSRNMFLIDPVYSYFN
jgi:hypothetical protein